VKGERYKIRVNTVTQQWKRRGYDHGSRTAVIRNLNEHWLILRWGGGSTHDRMGASNYTPVYYVLVQVIGSKSEDSIWTVYDVQEIKEVEAQGKGWRKAVTELEAVANGSA
jgi:hypothetical protein